MKAIMQIMMKKIKTLTSYISSSIVQRNTKLTNIYINILDEEIKKTPPKWCNWQMVTRTGFEPVNACVKGMWVNRFSNEPHGAWSRTRTYDRSVNSRLLLPTELFKPIQLNGAGDGNRTHVSSLEGWKFYHWIHPHYLMLVNNNTLIK